MEMEAARRKAKAVIVGDSIAGIYCAHAMIAAGWDVAVLEKQSLLQMVVLRCWSRTRQVSVKLIEKWTQQPQLLQQLSLPMTIEHEQATDGEKKITWTLSRDEHFSFRAMRWADLHSLLYSSLE